MYRFLSDSLLPASLTNTNRQQACGGINTLKKCGFVVGLCAIIFLAPGMSHAACYFTQNADGTGGASSTQTPQDDYVTLPATITVPRGTATGQSVAMNIPPLQDRRGAFCDAAFQRSYVPARALSPSTNTQMLSGVAGLELRNVINNGQAWYPWQGTGSTGSALRFPAATRTVSGLQLLVTGAVSPGRISAGLLRTVNLDTLAYSRIFLANDIAVVVPTCSVTTPSVSVTLAPVAAKDLAAIGSSAKETAFNIGLNCSGVGGNVYATLTDNTMPGNRTNQLSLATGSTAAGVALQILYGGSLVSFGADSSAAGNTNQFYVNAAANLGAGGIPLSVRYVRTSTNVVPGTVRGLATFTMSYQ